MLRVNLNSLSCHANNVVFYNTQKIYQLKNLFYKQHKTLLMCVGHKIDDVMYQSDGIDLCAMGTCDTDWISVTG